MNPENLAVQYAGIAALLAAITFFLKALAARDRVIEKIADSLNANTAEVAKMSGVIQKCEGRR